MVYGQLTALLPLMLMALAAARFARSARLEARGRLEEARLLARDAGRFWVGGAITTAVLLLVASDLPFVTRALVVALTAISAGIALLGGLAGKPRPSGWFATGFLAAAFVVLFAVR